jgi:hypothetical protein
MLTLSFIYFLLYLAAFAAVLKGREPQRTRLSVLSVPLHAVAKPSTTMVLKQKSMEMRELAPRPPQRPPFARRRANSCRHACAYRGVTIEEMRPADELSSAIP